MIAQCSGLTGCAVSENVKFAKIGGLDFDSNSLGEGYRR